jgi:hypothetical protein
MRSLIFYIIICCTFISCTKDKTDGCQVCRPHEELTNMQGQPIFGTAYPYNEMAYFNPNNSDEIIFRHADGLSPEFDLVKYNLSTKNSEIIYQGFFSKRPRWGKHGWILLNIQDDQGHNIYKIKQDGSELIKLTDHSHCFDPEWNLESDKFIYHLGLTSPSKSVLADEYGVFIDTLYCGGSGTGKSWQHPLYMASSSFKSFAFYNPLFCEDQYIFEVENLAQSLNGAEWLDEERVFWCHTTGIYITNTVTRETELIRETCNAHCYQRPTYAPDIDKIIVEKFERVLDNETSGRSIITLVMMNSDGTGEEVIEID